MIFQKLGKSLLFSHIVGSSRVVTSNLTGAKVHLFLKQCSVARFSVDSILWSFSIKHQLTFGWCNLILCWKWPYNWVNWRSRNVVLKMNGLSVSQPFFISLLKNDKGESMMCERSNKSLVYIFHALQNSTMFSNYILKFDSFLYL